MSRTPSPVNVRRGLRMSDQRQAWQGARRRPKRVVACMCRMAWLLGGFLALVSCALNEPASFAPPAPTASLMPTVGPTAAPAVLAAAPSPTETPPATSAPTIAPTETPVPSTTPTPRPPPASSEPLAQALARLKGQTFLYNGPDTGPALMIADTMTGQSIWLTQAIND